MIVRSEEGPATTSIDCQGAGRVIDSISTAGCAAALDGFTLTNCQSDVGGAIRLDHSQLQLRNCLVDSNSATVEGGGLFTDLSNPKIEALTLGLNSAPLAEAAVISNTNINLEGALHIDNGNT